MEMHLKSDFNLYSCVHFQRSPVDIHTQNYQKDYYNLHSQSMCCSHSHTHQYLYVEEWPQKDNEYNIATL